MYRFGLLTFQPELGCCDDAEKRTCFLIDGLFISGCVVDDDEKVIDLLVVVTSSASSSSSI